MHLLNRVTNKISCAVEVSASMAALAVLGGPTEFVSCSFFHVFVLEAIAYIKSHPNYSQSVQHTTFEFEELPGDEFSEDDDESEDNFENNIQDDSETPINFEELYNEDLNPHLLECTGENDELDSTSSHTTAKVYTTANGQVAVPQVVHYCFRGPALLEYSLYAYAALIDVIKNPRTNQSTPSEINTTNRGRPTNGMFQFAKGHPLFETHIQRLRSKPKVPVPRNVPRPPPAKPNKLTNSWKQQARIFSRYFLTLFKPWNFPTENGGTLPGSLTWNAFCEFIKQLEEGTDGLGPTFLERVTVRWIRSMAYGLRTLAQDRTAVQECRSRGVKTWDELAREPNNNISGDNSMENRGRAPSGEEEERNLALIAQLNVELLIAEAGNYDAFIDGDERQHQYLEATKTTLENLMRNSENVNINGNQSVRSNHQQLVHNFVEIEQSMKNVLEKIRPNYQEDLDEDFDQYLDDDEVGGGQAIDSTLPTTDPNMLNSNQQEILNLVREYIQGKRNAADGLCQSPKPFKILVHGGPGKSLTIMTSS